MNSHRIIYSFLVAVFCLTGCEGDGRTKVYPVTGKILINNRPAEGVAITFHPKSGDTTLVRATATSDKDGNLIVTTYDTGDGSPAGEFTLTIEWPTRVNAFGRMQNGPDRLGGQFATVQSSRFHVTIYESPTQLADIQVEAKIVDVKPGKVKPEDGSN